MKILIACESSGQMRRRLLAKGHKVLSCDVLPADDGDEQNHYVGDVREILQRHEPHYWDAIIGHPPCTYLSSSGLHRNIGNPERQAQTQEALEFFRYLWNQPAKIIVLENPVGAASRIAKPSVIVQPYMFGDDASKRTCFWMRGMRPLPLPHREVWHKGRLVAHNGKLVTRWSNQTDSGQNRLPPSADRWKLRSKTYDGIADYLARHFDTAQQERIAA